MLFLHWKWSKITSRENTAGDPCRKSDVPTEPPQSTNLTRDRDKAAESGSVIGEFLATCRLKCVARPARGTPWTTANPKTTRFVYLELGEAIDLRWTLRDIRSKRWQLAPINPAHIQKLREMGLVDIREGFPVLANAGPDLITSSGR